MIGRMNVRKNHGGSSRGLRGGQKGSDGGGEVLSHKLK